MMNAALGRRLVFFVLAGVAALALAPRDARAEPIDEIAEFNPLPPLVPREPPKTTFSELGVAAGFTGSSGGIGPVVVFRGGVRQDFGRFMLSVDILLSLEARSSDENGSLPPTSRAAQRCPRSPLCSVRTSWASPSRDASAWVVPRSPSASR